ncbi:transposase [Micromonospora sp. RTP1Z1]|uniref:transposase n=1 Tax=Micromonospora sp. RTP1Z1 TaxID=2994043 RepID=UPI0039B3BA31
MRRLRLLAGRVQRPGQARPPVGELPTQGHPAEVVNSLNGLSSRRLLQELPDLERHYHQSDRLWSRSYFAGTVAGAPLTPPSPRPKRGARARSW